MKCYLDRDGVLNYNYSYVGTVSRFELIPGIIEIMQYLALKGYELIIITNQSGIARNYYTIYDFYDLSFYMLNLFEQFNLNLEIRFCRHSPEQDCSCRKPKTGMINLDERDSRDIFI